ncbi:MAG: hypothetical protein AB7U75_02700 [Hyphomicrobiaceae bacterium]
MLKYAILGVAAAGLMLAHSEPASANAAMSGATNAPAAHKNVIVDVRRRGGGFRGHRGGGHRVHRGGGRHWGKYRGHRYSRRGHRRYYGGVYFGAPFLYYGYGYGYGNCRWLYRKAVRTGSRYWWRRYYRCRNYY